jgi:hypothetical protein
MGFRRRKKVTIILRFFGYFEFETPASDSIANIAEIIAGYIFRIGEPTRSVD